MTPWTIARQAPLPIGILQPRILEWIVMLSSGDLPDPGIEPEPPALAGGFFTTEPPGKPTNTGHRLANTSLFPQRPCYPPRTLPVVIAPPGRRTPRPSLRRAGYYQWCGSSEKRSKKVSLQSTCQAEINTSRPATYGSYRINKVDPLVYTEKLTQLNIHCTSNMGEFQIATK